MNTGNCHTLNYGGACVADVTRLAESYASKIQSVTPAVNARRVVAGKLELAAAWCLSIDVPLEIKGNGAPVGGTHRSPRMHLRRGHIRRLPDRNVWVNSTVVGSGAVKISKHYHLATE